jgi:hypothetical protein
MELIESTAVLNSNPAVEIRPPATEMKPAQSPGESTADLASSNSNDSSSSVGVNKPTITDYLDYFVHSLECKEPSCAMTKCRNFKRLFGHFKQCKKHFDCESCRWLLNLIIIHSKACDNHACNIPLCFTIKTRINEKEVFNRKMESIKEFLVDNVTVLGHKSKSTRTCQTAARDGDESSTSSYPVKRKFFDELETAKEEESRKHEEEDESTRALALVQSEAAQKKAALLAKLDLLKQDMQTSGNDNKDSCASLFEKGIRHEIVKYVVESSMKYVSSRETLFNKNNFIPITIHIIKKEQAVFRKAGSSDDYLHLMSELMFSVLSELEKRLLTRNVNAECQVCQADFGMESDDESTQAEESAQSSKRIKLD